MEEKREAKLAKARAEAAALGKLDDDAPLLGAHTLMYMRHARSMYVVINFERVCACFERVCACFR